MHNKDDEYLLHYKLDPELDKQEIADNRRRLLNGWSMVLGMIIMLVTVILVG